MSNETPSPAIPPVTPAGVPSGENFAANEKATSVDRLVAAIIDWLVCLPCVIPCIGLFLIPVAIGYALTKDALPFLGGQSIGKKLMKIRAVTETGESLSGNWGPAIIRQVGFVIPIANFIYLIVEVILLFTDKDTLRFGDKWAKTKVVKVAK